MPRSSSRSSSSRPAPAPAPRVAPPPARSAHAPPPPAPRMAPPPMQTQQPSGGGMMSGFGGMIMQGMAIGAGSEIGHRVVGGAIDAMSGGGSKQSAPQPTPQAPPAPQYQPTDVCYMPYTEFASCMKQSNHNTLSCENYFLALQQCQSSQQQNGGY